MRFIGLDLAWSARNLTGAAVTDGDEHQGSLIETRLLSSDDEVINFVQQWAANDSAIVAIDAPLIVPNEAGRRPAEAEIAAAFARYEAGAHPANRARLAVDVVVRGEAIVQRLEALGFVHRAEVEARVPVRQVIEVFPHPAMIALFNLDRTLKYKTRPRRSYDQRIAEFARYQALLRSLQHADPALLNAAALLNHDLDFPTKARLKDHEDVLDGLMCAYIAQYLWRWGMGRAHVFGNFVQGYITTPVPDHIWQQ